MVDRMKELRKSLGYTQKEFAQYLGITQTAYSMIENAKRPLAETYIKIICATFNVNETWLRTGDGDIFLSSPLEKQFTEILVRLTPNFQEFLLHVAEQLLLTQQNLLPRIERP